MSAKEDAAYQEWVKEVEGKLPEEVKDSFKALTSHDSAREVFRGNLRRQDYDRRVGEVESERRRLEAWFKEEAQKNPSLVSQNMGLQAKVATYEQTLRDLGLSQDELTTTPSGRPSPSVARKEEIEEAKAELKKEFEQKLNVLDAALPALLGDLATVVSRSNKEGYDVDPRDVIAYASENRVTPLQAFDALTAGERAKKDAEKQKALEEKWKEEGRREALSKLPSNTYIRPAGPSTFDSLTNKDFASDPRSRVAAAVKGFMEGDFSKSGSGLV